MANLISIAFACDDLYTKHVAVVIQSIFANAAPENRHEFHVLTMGITPESEMRLIEVATSGGATMLVHRVDPKLLAGFTATYVTLDSYIRLLLPEVLPNHDKVLYLDADLIVMDSLRELWETNIENFAAAAARDGMTITKGPDLEHFEAFNFPKEHIYFNAGVLLLNLKVLREMQLLERVKVWAEKNSHLMKHNDQDALNVILAGQIVHCHLRWNLQAPLIAPIQLGWKCSQEHEKAVSNPAIIHYVTNRKPWRKEFKLPYQSLYFKYLAQTPWKEDTIDPFTADLVWQRCLEELEWGRKLVMSKIRRLIGRRFILSDETK
jgi:lipopolysaccharide biosynthesis glycosyltransferase